MTNFDFLKCTPDFSDFSGMAISSELLLHVDADACVLCCRRALETALRWVYSVEPTVTLPHSDTLVRMINDPLLMELIGNDLFEPLNLIRKRGNAAAHGSRRTTKEEATDALRALFVFFDRLSYLYATDYRKRPFDPALLDLTVEEALAFVSVGNEENAPAAESPSERRAAHPLTSAPHPHCPSDRRK